MDDQLRIPVFGAFATAPTELAAFDRALGVGGVHNVNLITLSSIVPPKAVVRRSEGVPQTFEHGDRLYCVLAEQRTSEFGTEAWAGICWAIDQHERGGIFVESHGASRAAVEADLVATTESMIADRPEFDFGPPDMEIAGGPCTDDPVCALVLAALKHEPW